LLRGLEKVEIEVGLLALSHNLRKIAAKTQQKILVFAGNRIEIPEKLYVLKITRKNSNKKAVSIML
jgi:hypothetical protein